LIVGQSGWEGVDWPKLTQDMNILMNLWGP